MRQLCFPVFITITLFSAWARPALSDVVLPTIDDDEVTKATGVAPNSRSLIERDHRSTYLLNRLLEIAREARSKGDYEDALKAFEAARKVDREYNNGNFFRGNPEIGFLLGEMNRWIEAKRIFDQAVNSRWRTAEAGSVVEFCLTHKQANLVSSYKNVLNKGVEDPNVTLVYSKLLAAGKDTHGAIAAANRAYYLAFAKGVDASKAKANLQALTHSLPPEPTPNKSFQKEFWSKIDKLVALSVCPTPSYVPPLVDPPRLLNGSIGNKGRVAEIGFLSEGLKGSVRQATLQYDSDYRVNGIGITTNILTCCLTKQDLLAHLKEIHGDSPPKLEAVDSGNPDYENFQIKNDRQLVVYGFQKKGFGGLTGVSIYWNAKGVKLIDTQNDPRPLQPSWTSLFEKAKADLQKRHFKECRRKLCRTIMYWEGQSLEKANISPDVKRREYEAFKKTFVDLYTAWGQYEIAEYFELVSYPQLQREVWNCDSEMITEFPTAAEFRHNKWKVRWVQPNCFDVQIKDLGSKSTFKGSALYDALAKLCGEDPNGEEKEIYPPPAKIVDDEVFKENGTF